MSSSGNSSLMMLFSISESYSLQYDLSISKRQEAECIDSKNSGLIYDDGLMKLSVLQQNKITGSLLELILSLLTLWFFFPIFEIFLLPLFVRLINSFLDFPHEFQHHNLIVEKHTIRFEDLFAQLLRSIVLPDCKFGGKRKRIGKKETGFEVGIHFYVFFKNLPIVGGQIFFFLEELFVYSFDVNVEFFGVRAISSQCIRVFLLFSVACLDNANLPIFLFCTDTFFFRPSIFTHYLNHQNVFKYLRIGLKLSINVLF